MAITPGIRRLLRLSEVLREYNASGHRYIRHEFAEEPVYAGVPQGSVIGPFLWNVVFDDIVRRHDNDRVRFVAFANDLAILVSAVD